MTKEELRKEATTTVEWECTPMIDRPTFINGYIVGAEPREEQIAKLKEENTELKTKKIPQLERRIASIRGSHSVDVKKLNARTEQVERLKKENAELKKDKKELCHSISEGGKACVYLNEQLTKAKEIIKDLLGSENTSCEEEMFFEIRQKAEQFLKSEV